MISAGAIAAIGIIAHVCFAYGAAQIAYLTNLKGSSIGTPIKTAFLVLTGIASMYVYLYLLYGFNILIAVSYAFEAACWLTVVKYHYWPRTQTT